MTARSSLAYTTTTNGESVSHLSKLLGDVKPDAPAKIHRPRVAKRAWRTKGEPFDPNKVARL